MERSWFGRKETRGGGGGEEEKVEKVVVDGSEIRELVEDREAFGMFVESKFRQLDADGDGRLSVRELQPAVADISAALGLPAQGSSPNADHIYSEVQVMSEFTHGKKEEVSRTEFQEVLSDILLGMAAGLKRDPIVILRIDGEDLRDFVDSPRYEPEAAAIFSQIGSEDVSLRQCLLAALQQMSVDHGMPPASDPWVVGNVIEPALQQLSADQHEQPASQDAFLEQLKKLLSNITKRLQEQPVIVAHTEDTFNGSGVKRLLANKFEMHKLLDSVWKDVPIEHKNKASKEYLRVALDKMAGAASLPPYGAVTQVDAVVNEALEMANTFEGKAVDEAEFKKLLTEVLGAVMLSLNGDPIFFSTNTVVHEPLSSSSTLLSSPPVTPSPSDQREDHGDGHGAGGDQDGGLAGVARRRRHRARDGPPHWRRWRAPRVLSVLLPRPAGEGLLCAQQHVPLRRGGPCPCPCRRRGAAGGGCHGPTSGRPPGQWHGWCSCRACRS